MQVTLDYGKTGLEIAIPDYLSVGVIRPTYSDGLKDPVEAVRKALESPIELPPLSECVKSTDRVGIVVNDITRPTPYRFILPALLEVLNRTSVHNITFFVALGTHRENTKEELCSILGEDIVDRYRIVQNNAFDRASQVSLGNTSQGNEVRVNREFYECTVKILTGFVEPHFFAGYSGGPKAVVPGMACLETVLMNHSAAMIDDPNATWGVTEKNPIWEEISEAARPVTLAGRTYLLNVTLNREKKITAVFAGDLIAAHRTGCNFVKKTAMVSTPEPFDIVIASNSGYPLDLNLYQAVKGMSAAAQIVREGGSIVVAADCWDGVPEHGLYGELLSESKSPEDLLRKVRAPGFAKQDQWQAQIQAKVQIKAEVWVYSHNLTTAQVESALLKKSERIEDTVLKLAGRYGKGASVCVLPEGPQTIPYIG